MINYSTLFSFSLLLVRSFAQPCVRLSPSPLLPSLAFGDKAKHGEDGCKDKGQDKQRAKSGGREAAAQKPRRGLQLFSEVNTSNVRVTRASLHAFVYILYLTSYVRWRFS